MPPNRGALAREGELLGEAALNGDVLAVETNSNEIHFLLVKVTDDGLKDVPDGYVCPMAVFTAGTRKRSARGSYGL